jgi:hypothetical protein
MLELLNIALTLAVMFFKLLHPIGDFAEPGFKGDILSME